MSLTQEAAKRPVHLRRFVGDALGQSAQFRIPAACQLLRVSRNCTHGMAQSEREFGGHVLAQLLIVTDSFNVSCR